MSSLGRRSDDAAQPTAPERVRLPTMFWLLASLDTPTPQPTLHGKEADCTTFIATRSEHYGNSSRYQCGRRKHSVRPEFEDNLVPIIPEYVSSISIPVRQPVSTNFAQEVRCKWKDCERRVSTSTLSVFFLLDAVN